MCAFVWRDLFAGSHPIFYDDNKGAEFSLLNGFSFNFSTSLLLAIFWGASAAQRSRPWITRVASSDNPADCLTKRGLPRDHLSNAVFEQVEDDLKRLWDFLVSHLTREEFPAWKAVEHLFEARFQ